MKRRGEGGMPARCASCLKRMASSWPPVHASSEAGLRLRASIRDRAVRYFFGRSPTKPAGTWVISSASTLIRRKVPLTASLRSPFTATAINGSSSRIWTTAIGLRGRATEHAPEKSHRRPEIATGMLLEVTCSVRSRLSEPTLVPGREQYDTNADTRPLFRANDALPFAQRDLLRRFPSARSRPEADFKRRG